MLRQFYTTRRELVGAEVHASSRSIRGKTRVSAGNLERLQQLQDGGYINSAQDMDGRVLEFALLELHPGGLDVVIVLNPVTLHYYENLEELITLTAQEPERYYVHAVGEIARASTGVSQEIIYYRQMLSAKAFLQEICDFGDAHKIVFFAPEKLEIVLSCKVGDLRELPEIAKLSTELSQGVVERDQRIVLFKRSLRDHLRVHPVVDRFGILIRNLASIYDGYRRDYELWLGNTFADIKKSFEEKRLKFVSDLTSVLAAIQASILAVPLGAILIADKFEFQNPLKNFFLASAVLGVIAVAWKLLANQQHSLDSTKAAIDAVSTDYQKQQPAGSREFTSRLAAVETQERKVRLLLDWFRFGLVVISTGVSGLWLSSYVSWGLHKSHSAIIVVCIVWILSQSYCFWSVRQSVASLWRARR